MNELKEKCENFIKHTPISVRHFCKRVGLSPEGYYKWQRSEIALKPKKIRKIEAYFSSKDAQELQKIGQEYLPTHECAKRTGYAPGKITRLCALGAVNAIKSSGNRWYINIFDLEKYLDRKYPSKHGGTLGSEESVFGNLYSEWNVSWRPLLSRNNDYELFDLTRHEYDKQYWISSNGKIYNTETGQILGSEPDDDKYIRVNLRKKNSDVTCYVHRLVAYCFCPNSHYKCEVHHINGKKSDNCASNLIWVTVAEHDECHRLMKKSKKAYRKYLKQLQKDNRW